MENLTPAAFLIPMTVALWVLWELVARVPRSAPAQSPPEPLARADVLIPATIAGLFYLLALWRLGTPEQFVFDEVHHVRTAMEYIEGLNPHEWTHPPLAKLIMAASMKVWGGSFDPRDAAWDPQQTLDARTTIGWRYPGVVFGAFALIALYALTRTLFENRKIAAAATLMLALDGVFFVHSRIGMTNIYTVCFILLGTTGTWLYIKRGSGAWLLLSGLGLGLALATRWTSLWAWGFNGLLLCWHLFAGEWRHWAATGKKPLWELVKWVGRIGGAMIVLPLAVYFLSYIPFVLQGEGAVAQKLFTSGEPGRVDWGQVLSGRNRAWGNGWYKVLEQQGDMWRYHTSLKERHPYESPWWSWPLMLRPPWYYFESVEGKISGIWSIGNAFLWWGSLPALAMAAFLAHRERRTALGVVALMGIGMWLCWGIKPRPLIFMHYYFEAVPFACIALAYLGWRIWESNGKRDRFVVQVYASLIGLWFAFYYPLLVALPVPDWFFRLHLWLKDVWV
ncbi:MAG: phospholipid carrier-dependent glycosyltransferase [Armatimonadaceae bacterium]